MPKSVVVFSHELLRSNDSGIREIAGAVPETADAADFKILFAFFCNNFSLDNLRLHFSRVV